jgi:hypothetical protein
LQQANVAVSEIAGWLKRLDETSRHAASVPSNDSLA